MKLERKTETSAQDLMTAYIKLLKIGPALNTRRIFETWKAVSGAEKYTLKLFFRDGTLHVKLSSSVIRNILVNRTNEIIAQMNEALEKDSLFIKDDPKVGYVKRIELR